METIISFINSIASLAHDGSFSCKAYDISEEKCVDGKKHVHDFWELKYFCESREFILIAPLTVHRTTAFGLEVVTFCFENSESLTVGDLMLRFDERYIKGDEYQRLETLCNGHVSLLRNIVENLTREDYCRSLISVFLNSLIIVLEDFSLREAPPIASKTEQMIHFISRNYYNSSLSVADIAAEVNLCPNYASRLFKKATGIRLVEFIHTYRLDKAYYLLGTGRYSVKEVAQLCGWSNQFYFSNCFKKSFGLSPSELGVQETFGDHGGQSA
ncbi:helix-turn-helix transcriptional regulator [Lentisphaerota bacterium ZTH]|nr:helix-turn-helix transcriptional regulator [Lentisphaerota bacterium]WET06679.1 helix-turn-helix transcriptional regulator [Lentisphaerota bacterium ZTH]